MIQVIASEAANPRGSAVELANHRAVREYRRKISSQRKGPFFDHIYLGVSNTPYLGRDVMFLHVSLPLCGLCCFSSVSASEIEGSFRVE